ncbi:MAG: thiamine pyrophosphate-binding protein [Alphaproteobacteria bacterium]|nr:thiamine pyrophosphate-binding protein [Alphaproteobacteria bacterium]
MTTVGEAVGQTLKAYGTEYFFCFCGGDHELWYGLEQVGIRIINCRSEAGAVYMADGYARVSGKPGFVYGQRGPGVSNVAGAMADPLWASSPVVSLTSSIAMSSRDRFEYQELDGLPMHDAVTRWNKTVSAPERAAAMVRAAIRIATGPAPGPVHLEIPADMFSADAGADTDIRDEALGTVTARRIPPPAGVMARVNDRLIAAERPIIVAGKGVVISEAWDALRRYAEALNIPVVTSLGGKGAIAESWDLAVGTMGRNSRKVGNDTVRKCDTVLAIGTRLGGLASHRWTLPFGEKALMQIDSNAAILGHNFPAEITVLADARDALDAGVADIEARGLARGRTPWAEEIAADIKAWRGHAADFAKQTYDDGINPAHVLSELRGLMAPSDIVGADTGAHGAWVGSLFPVEAGKTMVRANGSLGWVFPGAMGAGLAAPGRRTVAVSGDGGMLYHIAELETALRLEIPVVAVVLNNAALASEYHTQVRHWNGHYIPDVIDFRDVDFAAVARAFGAFGARVEDPADVRDALREALDSGLPAVVDVKSSKEAKSPSANNDADRLV